jgi:phosphoglycolate phosphatase-like HAD superfamily hydrolase
MRPAVFLFDIDGTLLSTGGAGRRSMVGAFRALYDGAGASALEFSFAGMTDHAIVRAGLLGVGVEPTRENIERVLETYLARLKGEVLRSDEYRVHAGVTPVLEWLPSRTNTAIGLGTGNIRAGAYAKLQRGALDSRFAFGGFGCDAENRAELLRVGAERGAAHLGTALSECRVVVIGDTPKDVAAAIAIDAVCIGVGTGGFEPQTLAELGAFAAFATLEDAEVQNALLEAASREA